MIEMLNYLADVIGCRFHDRVGLAWVTVCNHNCQVMISTAVALPQHLHTIFLLITPHRQISCPSSIRGKTELLYGFCSLPLSLSSVTVSESVGVIGNLYSTKSAKEHCDDEAGQGLTHMVLPLLFSHHPSLHPHSS